MKRVFDFLLSFFGLVVFSPLLITCLVLVWCQDRHSPLYISYRVGKHGRLFKMVKIRSMLFNADMTGVDSTGDNDARITKIGHLIRRLKIDEIAQLWNVLIGEMSLVGPRPNVERETRLYTDLERVLLTVKPGITDFASIVFSDEGTILSGHLNPDVAYNQLIRPEKSALGLFYVKHSNIFVDFALIILTLISVISRSRALTLLNLLLRLMGANPELLEMALRKKDLIPTPPPGSNKIVTSRG